MLKKCCFSQTLSLPQGKNPRGFSGNLHQKKDKVAKHTKNVTNVIKVIGKKPVFLPFEKQNLLPCMQ